jgi:hypothetical protein
MVQRLRKLHAEASIAQSGFFHFGGSGHGEGMSKKPKTRTAVYRCSDGRSVKGTERPTEIVSVVYYILTPRPKPSRSRKVRSR